MDIKTIDLFGKSLFSWVTIPNLVNMHTPMPENEAAFVYVFKGACMNYTETTELNLSAGNSVLAKCGNSTFKTLTVNNQSEYSAISIRFHKDTLEQIYTDTPSPFYKTKNTPLSVNSVKIDVAPLIETYITGLLSYFNEKDSLTEELIILKLKELIALLLQTDNAPEVLQIMKNLFEKKTFEFKEIIKAHIYSSVCIDDLAKLTNRSLSSFKREFKHIYNDTPNNYLINKRIEKVAEQLPSSTETISSIAYDCNFKTLAHMSRVFKNKYGVSPSEYRLSFSEKI